MHMGPDEPPPTPAKEADVVFNLEVSMGVQHLTSVRRFVADLTDSVVHDSDLAARLAMATHELLENAVKYSLDPRRMVTLRLWVEAEVARITGRRLAQKLASGQPGPEGSMMKLLFAKTAQELSGLEVEMLGEDGLRYEDGQGWTMVRPERVDFNGRDAGYRYLRAKGNSIEGGTSEIIRNIVAERVLGLPAEHRTDKDRPWKELAR